MIRREEFVTCRRRGKEAMEK